MTKRTALILTLATLLTYMLGQSGAAVFAATANPTTQNVGQALEIAPPVVNLSVSPGQSISVPIYLRDIAPSNLVVTGQADDFVAGDENGTPKILLDKNETSPYSLKGWVQTLPSLTLVPHEIKAMTVVLNVPSNASPGGHYGVIRFTATPPNLQGTGLSLSASLGALLLVTVSGHINENLTVQNFYAAQNNSQASIFEAAPLTFVAVLKNSGNVHEEPTGQITITDMLGHTFASISVNMPPHNILPDSLRQFDASLDSTVYGTKFMFGHYTATLHLTYGTDKKALTSQISFWVIPYRLIAFTIIGLIVAFFALRFLIRRYNQHIISQSRRSHR